MKYLNIEELKKSYQTPVTPGSFMLSLEGIEGSGKSTQISQIESFLKNRGLNSLTLREPGGTVFGEKLREAILLSTNPLHPLAECHLFLASRAQLIQEKILPFLLKPGSVVILDRYIDSTLAYQGKARGLGYETILDLHKNNPLNLLPHRTYFLDINLDLSYQRQQNRGQKKDYFESEKHEFYQKLTDGYKEVATFFPERILKIDGSQASETITQIIIKDLEDNLL